MFMQGILVGFLIGITLITIEVPILTHFYLNASSSTIGIWRTSLGQTYPANTVAVGFMMDTFDNHIVITSNKTISLQVLSIPEYEAYIRGENYTITTNYLSKNIDFWFNESEGCSGYIYLVQTNQSTRVFPDVSAKYNPSSNATGICDHQ